MGGTSRYSRVYLFKLSLCLLVTMLHHKEGHIRYKQAVCEDIYHVPGKYFIAWGANSQQE